MANQCLFQRLFSRILTVLVVTSCTIACVDPEAILLRGTVDVIVVDGTINNLAEPQLIQYANGGFIQQRTVGQIPYYTHNAALIEVRQSALSRDAYRFFTLFQQQSQNTGGIADSPPAALVGNVQNVANAQEKVVGYFTAGAVSSIRYWLDKKDATGIPLGGTDETGAIVPGDRELFFALNRRLPKPEPQTSSGYSLGFVILGGGSRPPTALCVASDSKTLNKPEGWRN